MNKDELLILFKYNTWANQRILKTTEKLSSEKFTEKVKFGYGNLRETLVHILVAEFIWCVRWEGKTLKDVIEVDDFPNFSTLQIRWHNEEQHLAQFLEHVSDYELNQPIRYTTSKGNTNNEKLWQQMVHLVNHGTQHRSEAAALLTSFGHSPGDLDFIVFLRENRY